MVMSSSLAVAMVRVSDTEALCSRSEVSDTGRFMRSVSAAALF